MNAASFVANVKKLPPSPQVLPNLMDAMHRDEINIWEIADLVNLDPSLAAQVLALSNSSYYAYRERSTNLQEAVERIGLTELYKLVGLLISRNLTQQPLMNYGVNAGELWEASIACALAMEFIAKEVSADERASYTAGLFHSLGKIVINQELGEKAKEIFELIEKKNISLSEAEVAILGFDHADVGMELLKKWNFSDMIYEPVGYQFKPMQAPTQQVASCMIHLSLYVVASIGKSCGKSSFAFTMSQEPMDLLKIDDFMLQQCIVVVHENLKNIKEALSHAV